ncbi:MAG: S-layer homology domain-containing protein [Mogibacterium sp.]|nr:S-layer homology domain-containing protein [Mogibacterium sp.]
MKWRKVLALALSTAMVAGVCPISAAELEVTEELAVEADSGIVETYDAVEPADAAASAESADESYEPTDIATFEEEASILQEEEALPEEDGFTENVDLFEESVEEAELFVETDTDELLPSDEGLTEEAEPDMLLSEQTAVETIVEEQTEAEELALAGAGETEQQYVLMNIPYDKFYEAEGVAGVDAVTSATLNKPRTGGLAGGSYHVKGDGTDITGVIYPVLVEDPASLAGFTQITDESSVDITVTNRGQTTTTTYTGQDALFEAPSYAYYTLSIKPAYYKVLNADGSFSAVVGDVSSVSGVTGDVTVGARHADIEIKLSGTTGIETGAKVSGVVLTDADGNKYGLRHVANIWRGTEIGWNLSDFDLGGKTITNIRYYTTETVIDYPVQIAIAKAGYVLMNIPYDKFYEAEGVAGVDAVTSATLNKPRTGGLAGGSYHVNSDGSDITGIIYPVFIKDLSVLANYTQITDESSVDITVTNRGQTTTTTYAGQEALFEAPSYAYYMLSEKPARYKTLNEDGSFSAVSGRATTVEGVTGEVTVGARHADIEISLTGTEGIDSSTKISGVVLTDADGNTYGLRHIANIWRGTEIGWDNDEFALFGKTLTNIRYYTQESVIDFPVNILVRKLFDDVTNPDDFYFEPIYWAVDNNITTGWDDNTFRPMNDVNRAAVVTFLWRMAGKPEPTKEASFKDMTGNEEFDKAISWAAEEGITTGWSDNTFRPWDTCKRAAIVTFIWRYANKPEPSTTASFTDMTGNEEFDKAISWAAEKGITTGYEEDNTFRPYITCKRLAIVSFLQRYATGLEG